LNPRSKQYRHISELSGRKMILPAPAFNIINGGIDAALLATRSA
jgi:enolase